MKRTIAIIGAAVMIVAVAVYANTNTAQQSDASCPNRPGCICEPVAAQEPASAQEPAAGQEPATAEASCPDTPECVCLEE